MGQLSDIKPEIGGPVKGRADLIVRGVRCAGCVSKIEREINDLTGIKSARVNLSTSRLDVSWEPGRQDVQSIISHLSELGFPASPYQISEAERQAKAELSFLLRCLAVAGFAVMNVMLLSISVWSSDGEMQQSTQTLLHWLSALIAVPAVIYSGRPFFRSAATVLRKKQTNMDVPIALAILLAVSLSLCETIIGNPHTYFDAAIMLVFLLLIGRYLDSLMRHKSGEAARALAALQVPVASRLREDGTVESIPGSHICEGDRIVVPSGQTVPVDGKIIAGATRLDAKIVTGESRPVAAGAGMPVYSGMINLGHPITIRAVSRQADSFLSEISRLVEAGQQSKSRYVKIADKAARAYVPVVHSLAVLTFVGWLIGGADLRHALICAIAVLIITCPCALGLAVPAVNIVSSGRLFANGILIRSGDVLERLEEVGVAVFDKTGTLTTGMATLANKETISSESLRAAISVARHSAHPLSRSLSEFDTPYVATEIHEYPGEGIVGLINGRETKLGSATFVGVSNEDLAMQRSWIKYGDLPPECLLFEDGLRPEARETIAALARRGIDSQILSGDSPDITFRISHEAGISVAEGGLRPEQKLQKINELTKSGHYPLMIGDGINDAPSLAGAFVSASLASGSDVAQASSDIILQRDTLSALPEVIDIARRSQKRIRENIALSVGYNMLAIPLAVAGLVTPLIAALAMSGSSLLVTLNAMRMRAS